MRSKPSIKLSFFFIFLLSLFCQDSFAQNKILDKVNALMEIDKHRDAIPILEKQIIKDDAQEYRLKLAQCYQKIGNTEKAMENYEIVIQTEALEIKDAEMYTALLILKGRPMDAKSYIEKANMISREADNQLYWIGKIDEDLKKEPQYTVAEVSLNTEFSESNPVLYKKGMMFSAAYVANKTGEMYEDLYYTVAGNNPTQFKSADVLQGNISGPYGDLASTFQRDSRMFFTRTSPFKGNKALIKEGILKSDIYGADIEEKINWSVNDDFPWNSKDYSSAHPAWSPKDRRLYFISDKPGGIGGTDIYYTEWKGKQWSEPKNMGDAVNTNQDEKFPYVAQDGNLYFASKGRNTFGGFDIFCLKRDAAGKWEYEPEHLGAAINSDADDFGITFNKDMKSGYFTSNREGGKGGNDIYYFALDTVATKAAEAKADIISKKEEAPSEVVWIQMPVHIYDEDNFASVTNADVVFTAALGEKVTVKSDNEGLLFAKLNKNLIYSMTIQKSGYLLANFEGITPEKITKDVGMSKLTENKTFTVSNIYYDSNKFSIRQDSKSAIDPIVKLMKNNPEIKVEISSHTDSRGSDVANLTLSQQRSKSVHEYIVSQGIAVNRLVSLGFGENRLLNKCKNDIPCSETEHEQNRRTEFKIIGIVK
jgi:outer membrane protein OmpA-like peptidoglycan-associated protein